MAHIRAVDSVGESQYGTCVLGGVNSVVVALILAGGWWISAAMCTGRVDWSLF